MIFSVQRDEINTAVSIVTKAAAVRGIQPVLSNILIDALGDNEIKLCATDLDIYIEMKISATITQKGTITIPARKLNEIISKLPNQNVNFKINSENNTAEIKCGSAKFDIKGISANEFPYVEPSDSEDYIEIEIEPFLKAVKQTIFAAATYDINNVLSGVFCKINDNILEIVTLDGNRLARVRENIENKDNKAFSAIIPSRTLKEFSNILSGSKDKTVFVTVKNSQILFKLSDRYITSRLIEGQYPSYNQLIPENYIKKAVINKDNLITLLDRVSTMANERTNIVKLLFTSDNLKITADAPDLGDSCDQTSVDYKGEDLNIAFNYRYMQDFLKVIESENVILEMDGSLSGTLFKTDDERDILCLIMPVQVD